MRTGRNEARHLSPATTVDILSSLRDRLAKAILMRDRMPAGRARSNQTNVVHRLRSRIADHEAELSAALDRRTA